MPTVNIAIMQKRDWGSDGVLLYGCQPNGSKKADLKSTYQVQVVMTGLLLRSPQPLVQLAWSKQ
jgi:hypothetical protein